MGLWNFVWVMIGGAIGSAARFWGSVVIAQRFGETFPWGTLIVNVIGCFVIGLFNTLTGPDGRWFLPIAARQFVMIGLCGGFTTFSAFSLQTLSLIQNGEWLHAGNNVLLSVLLCMIAVWLGHVLAANVS
jgi:fluoride exporter